MDVDVFLSPESKITANHEKNVETARLKYAGHDEQYIQDKANALDEVVHAVRISYFVDNGSYDNSYIITKLGETGDTEYGGLLDLNKDGYYDYDAENNKEYCYGEYDGELVFDPAEDNEDIEAVEEAKRKNTFFGVHKQGVEKAKLDSIQIKKERAVKIDSLVLDDNQPFKEPSQICHVKPGEEKRIVISIYVEGWDIHMTDDIASATFDVNISFTGLLKD